MFHFWEISSGPLLCSVLPLTEKSATLFVAVVTKTSSLSSPLDSKGEVVVVTVADLIWSCKEELLGNVVGNFVGKVVVVRWHCVCNGAVSTENQQRAYCGANIFLCETFSY